MNLRVYFTNSIHRVRFVATDGEIFHQHRIRNIKHQHDVEFRCFDLGEATCPSCGLAIPTINAAEQAKPRPRKMRPARLVLLFFRSPRNGAVAENTIAARGPNLPRSHASKGNEQ